MMDYKKLFQYLYKRNLSWHLGIQTTFNFFDDREKYQNCFFTGNVPVSEPKMYWFKMLMIRPFVVYRHTFTLFFGDSLDDLYGIIELDNFGKNMLENVGGHFYNLSWLIQANRNEDIQNYIKSKPHQSEIIFLDKERYSESLENTLHLIDSELTDEKRVAITNTLKFYRGDEIEYIIRTYKNKILEDPVSFAKGFPYLIEKFPELILNFPKLKEPLMKHYPDTDWIEYLPDKWGLLKLAVLDVDNTLIDGILNIGFSLYLVKNGFVDTILRDEMNSLVDRYRAGEITYDTFRYLVNGTYAQRIKGKRVQEISELAEKYVQNEAVVMPYTQGLISGLRQREFGIILTSSSPLEIVTPLSKMFSVDKVFATELEISK